MRGLLLSVALSCLTTACAGEPERSDPILNEIEQLIALPQDAFALEEYGRAYARSGNKVIGHYLVPIDYGIGPNDDCEEAQADGSTIPCAAGWREQYEAQIPEQVPAGERRWYDDPLDLPFISDGGCLMISFDYHLDTKRFSRVECNGVA